MVSPDDGADSFGRCFLPRPRLRPRCSHSSGASGTEAGSAAVGQNDVEPADVIDGLAVDDGARAGGVVAHHAAEVGPARRGHFRTELEVVLGQCAIERSRTTPG